MAVKTITIDLDAYAALSRHKRPGQSFSQVIKEYFGTNKTGRELSEALERVSVADDTIDAIEERVAERRKDRARAVRL